MDDRSDKREEILATLKETLDEAKWEWLRPHAQRDVVLVVNHDLDLLEAAYRIAIDDRMSITAWLESGLLTRPTPEQLALWEQTPERKFLCVVVQPYVLAQEHLLH